MGQAIQAIIFDCFGVLITDGLEAAIQQLEKTNPQARSFISSTIKQNNSGLIAPAESNRRIAEYLGISAEEWRGTVSGGEVKNHDLLQWIIDLRKQYKTAVLSNVGRGSLTRRFSEQELTELFDAIIVSAEVGLLKPDPEIYHLTADKLGVPIEACAFLDDRELYVQAAIDTGMHGIYYQTFQQARAELEALLASNS